MSQVRFYRPGSPIGPNTILYLDNRPNGPHDHHNMMQRLYAQVQTINGGGTADGVSEALCRDTRLHDLMRKGLENGSFKDTTLVSQWVDTCNTECKFQEQGLRPLELVVAHAETQIGPLINDIVYQRHHPAGIILSGSIKMLSQTGKADPVVQKTLELIRYLLREEIPTFGICFGMQLMAWVRFDALVVRRTLPDRAKMQIVQDQAGEFLRPVHGGRSQIVYGINDMIQTRPHPIFSEGRAKVLSIRAEHLSYPHPKIPDEHVIAFSTKTYLSSDDGDPSEPIHMSSIEILECGPTAMGVQFHPEAKPLFGYVLTYLDEFEDALPRDGYNLNRLRAAFAAQEDRQTPGSAVASAWVKHIAGQRYIQSQSEAAVDVVEQPTAEETVLRRSDLPS